MKCRILLVDDRDYVRAVLKIRLEMEEDFIVVGEAADGHEAVVMASAHQPDVVVMDNDMPVMTGLEALPRLKEVSPGSWVVMFSSDADLEPRAITAGVDAFVNKSEPMDSCVDEVAVGCRAA